MKKAIFLLMFLGVLFTTFAQENQKGSWVIRNGESVFVVSGASDFKPGIPNRNPQDPALVPLTTTFINFDDITAPCAFMETFPASNQYAAQGVTFSGTGFSILNECGSFSVSGYSSPNFLAWNHCCSGFPETLTFNPPVSNVSFLAGSMHEDAFSAEAFNDLDQSLGIVNVILHSTVQSIELPYPGIAKVVIDTPTSYGIVDDLMFDKSDAPLETPVSNWALFLGIGLILTFTAFRFRRMS